MTEPARAWLLELGEGRVAAVGPLEMAHLLSDAPAAVAVPHAPAYADRVFLWEGEMVPVLDLCARMSGRPARETPYLGVVRYREAAGESLCLGALALDAPPRRVAVSDDMACDLPDPAWRPFAISCFSHDEQAVPVLDLARVFAPPEKDVPARGAHGLAKPGSGAQISPGRDGQGAARAGHDVPAYR